MKHIIRCFFAILAIATGSSQAYSETVKLRYNGLNMVGEHVIAEGRQPTDKTILMLHGTLAHLGMETIKGLRDVLSERGYNSLSINLSFGLDERTGMYDCAIAHRHLYGDAVLELAAWLDWLAAKEITDVSLFGHSRGGAQAALFGAINDHVLVKRLVLLAPSTWNRNKAASGFKRSHGRDLQDVLTEAHALVKNGKGSDYMKGVGILYCPGADVTADGFLSYYLPSSNFDTPSLLPKIMRPVLVVTGGKDKVVPDIAARVKPLVADGKVSLVTVDDAGHFFLDLYAEDVADAIEEFDPPIN
jgi:pimeloyl-ACP methyl ester carboxylesterase